MDPLKILLQEVSPKLISTLTERSGFSTGQAEAFVPAAAKSALDFIRDQSDGLDLDDLPGLASRLASGIDENDLASQAGVAATQAQSGLETVLPQLLAAAEQKARLFGGLGAVSKMLGGGSPGLGGFASKLFGG